MDMYCFSCKKNTANEKSNAGKTKQNRLIVLSNRGICVKKIQLLLKTKNFTILIIFEMISLKWLKSLTHFIDWR